MEDGLKKKQKTGGPSRFGSFPRDALAEKWHKSTSGFYGFPGFFPSFRVYRVIGFRVIRFREIGFRGFGFIGLEGYRV